MPRGADDEPALKQDIIALAKQYGRYGYRRVTALTPDDPAGVIAFLTLADAAMMTGTIIDLDQFVTVTINDNPGR